MFVNARESSYMFMHFREFLDMRFQGYNNKYAIHSILSRDLTINIHEYSWQSWKLVNVYIHVREWSLNVVNALIGYFRNITIRTPFIPFYHATRLWINIFSFLSHNSFHKFFVLNPLEFPGLTHRDAVSTYLFPNDS